MVKKGKMNLYQMAESCSESEAMLMGSQSNPDKERQMGGALCIGTEWVVQRVYSNSYKNNSPFFSFVIHIDGDYAPPEAISPGVYDWDKMKYYAHSANGKKYFVKPETGDNVVAKELPESVYPYTHFASGSFRVSYLKDGETAYRKYYVYDFLDGSVDQILYKSALGKPYLELDPGLHKSIISGAFLNTMFYMREMFSFGAHILDIKPSNILYLNTKYGIVFKVSDFDAVITAKNHDSSDFYNSPNLLITHRYAAPVIVNLPTTDNDINRQVMFSDIFSAGIMLLELCIGENIWLSPSDFAGIPADKYKSYYYPEEEENVRSIFWCDKLITPSQLVCCPEGSRAAMAELIKSMLRFPDVKQKPAEVCERIISEFCAALPNNLPVYPNIPGRYLKKVYNGVAYSSAVNVRFRFGIEDRSYEIADGEVINVALPFTYKKGESRRPCKTGMCLANHNGTVYYYITSDMRLSDDDGDGDDDSYYGVIESGVEMKFKASYRSSNPLDFTVYME